MALVSKERRRGNLTIEVVATQKNPFQLAKKG